MAKKTDNTHLLPCICGNTPELISKITVLTKDEMFVYKCLKCGREGEIFWPKDSVNLIGSWNNTIRIIQGTK
jgi:hypothetical protein